MTEIICIKNVRLVSERTSVMSKTAHILAIEVTSTPPLGYNIGRQDCINSSRIWIGPRQHLEKLDPSIQNKDQMVLLQVIPYLVFEHDGKVLAYIRSNSGGDNRLHSKVSIGIGGHIDFIDAVPDTNGAIDLNKTLYRAAIREASEEIGLKLDRKRLTWTGTIYSEDTEVDRVHIGFIGFYKLNKNEVSQINANSEIGEHKFVVITEIETSFGDNAEIETWTKLIANPKS